MPSCEWRECDATLDSDEALYEHLCSAHYDDAPGDRTECRWTGCSVRPKGGKHYVFKHLIKQRVLHLPVSPQPNYPSTVPGSTCEWRSCTASGFTTPEQLSDHLLTAHAPTANGTCLWPSCNGKWFRPQNFSRHLRSAHSPSWYKPFACTAAGCGRTFKELGAMRHHVGYAHEGGKLKRKRKRGEVKMEVDTDEGLSQLSALSDDEETLDEPPAKRPRWPREPSFDSESENKDDLRAKRIVELEGALKAQTTRLQVAEKKIKTLQKQLADIHKAETASGSTAAKMESAPGELEQDEWTMWVDGVM
ncbi:hypothetical protein EXIGLDRAFT_774535 [Exidia glandulosa HHB12029]|uniref:C2H2-type domain-containing protein n=1 Tax=Exidia glandulosa HHB12029 TaxID=1314781 RepID=A0A165EB23_EXIGL|nr:hypothetical protein EXIGLDRAFT_774535 [Exidia glandulosa HHB12029]